MYEPLLSVRYVAQLCSCALRRAASSPPQVQPVPRLHLERVVLGMRGRRSHREPITACKRPGLAGITILHPSVCASGTASSRRYALHRQEGNGRCR